MDSKCLLSAIRVGSQEEDAISDDEIDEQGLLSLCGNFLVLDIQSHWRFSHLSVVEYLETAHHWSLPQAHSHIAIACLSFFITAYEHEDPPTTLEEWDEYDPGDEDNQPPDTLDIHDTANPFHRYARHHWVEHVHEANATESSPLGAHLKSFLGTPEESSVQYRRWLAQFPKEVFWSGDLLDRSQYQTSGFDLAKFKERESRYAYGGEFILASELEPTDRPVFAMCRFAFDSILSEWWDSPAVDVLQTNDLGHDLLTIAAIAGSASLCQKLIEKGANVNRKLADSIFGTALVAAAWWGHVDVIKCLVQAGADPNISLNSQEGWFDREQEEEEETETEPRAPEGWYTSPLTAAVEENRVEATKYLVNEAKANIHMEVTYDDLGSVLEIAASHGNHEIIKCLVQAGADVNKPPLNLSHGRIIDRALSHGDLKTIRFLIEEAGADIKTPLPGSDIHVLADVVANKRIDSVKYLVESCDFDVNQVSEYKSPLIAAAQEGDLDIVLYLVQHGADVNKPTGNDRKSPLTVAAYGGHIDIVRYLVQNGADPNNPPAGDDFGSALIAALVTSDGKECATFLVENGSDVNLVVAGEEGSALATAARMNSIEMVRLLLEAGADVNASLPSTTNGSALAAVTPRRGTGSTETVLRCLLDAGANVDMPLENQKYPSALSAAAAAGYADNVRILLEAGADPNLPLKGEFGSALAAAEDANRTDCVELLLNAGAQRI